MFGLGRLVYLKATQPRIMKKGYVEIHCHPSLKPFGKSFKTNTPGANSPNNKIGAEKLIDKVFTDNAMRFIEINFARGVSSISKPVIH